MNEIRCANCGYECEEVSEKIGYCQTCQGAYDKGARMGYRIAIKGGESND